jgi:hypothetical protein
MKIGNKGTPGEKWKRLYEKLFDRPAPKSPNNEVWLEDFLLLKFLRISVPSVPPRVPFHNLHSFVSLFPIIMYGLVPQANNTKSQGNLDHFQGQQADGLRSQEAGQLVVPASTNSQGMNPDKLRQQMFELQYQMLERQQLLAAQNPGQGTNQAFLPQQQQQQHIQQAQQDKIQSAAQFQARSQAQLDLIREQRRKAEAQLKQAQEQEQALLLGRTNRDLNSNQFTGGEPEVFTDLNGLSQAAPVMHQASSTSRQEPPIVNDYLSYLYRVKNTYPDRPDVYNHFLDILKNLKSQPINILGAVSRIANLFYDAPALIADFSTFLPPGWKVECGIEGDSGTAQVVSPEGIITSNQTITCITKIEVSLTAIFSPTNHSFEKDSRTYFTIWTNRSAILGPLCHSTGNSQAVP